mgnify:CR=1 FL=1|jgi:hypothetical protein
MKSQKAPVLSGHLCVSNYNDIQLLNNVIEFPFTGTSTELWKTAATKFQEYYALGWTPVIYLKSEKSHLNLQINVEDIDMIMSM